MGRAGACARPSSSPAGTRTDTVTRPLGLALGRAAMNDTAESAATRLWRDRAQLREQERNEAQAQARITEEKVASLTAENDRLVAENARLRALNDRLAAENARLRAQSPDPARAEIEQVMEDVRSDLLSLLTPANEKAE